MERFGLMQRRLRALKAPRPLIALALVGLTTLLLSWPLHLARGLYGSGDFSYAVDVAASLVILIFAGVVVQAWIEQADEERSEWIARLSYRSLKAWLLNARNELRVYDHGYDPRDWGGPCNADHVERMKHLLSTLGLDAASDAATRAARLRELSTHRRWLIDTWYGVKDLKVRGRDEVARFAPAMLRAKRPRAISGLRRC